MILDIEEIKEIEEFLKDDWNRKEEEILSRPKLRYRYQYGKGSTGRRIFGTNMDGEVIT